MMAFVIAVGACLVVAAALAAWPLVRRQTDADTSDWRGTNVGLYRQRVAEIERDRDAGRMSADVAASLIQEQAAALLQDASASEPAAASGARSVPAAVAVVVAIVAISLAMYHKLGAYDAVQLGEAAKALREAQPDPAALGDLVVRLRTHVASAPDDLESWYLLGHTLMRLDDPSGAVSAFEHVYAFEGDDPSVQVALAQARFAAAGGTMTDDNRALVDRILAADPRQSVALEMLAIDAFRAGDYVTAARHLQSALAGGGAGARTDALRQGLERARALMGDIGPSLDVTIDIDERLRNAMPPSAQLFVFARKPGERMPLLVARSPINGASMTLRLDRTNAMQGDVALMQGETLSVAARLSASGELTAGGDDPQASQDAVTLGDGVTPVRLVLGAASGAAASQGIAVTEPTATAKPDADATVRLSVAFAPGVDASPPARVFVIARAPNGPPMPIAVRALDPTALPQQLVLTDRDAMQPNRTLSMFDRVEVLARLSRSGNPVRQPGDIESRIQSLDPRGSTTISLIIGG
jgi:cytochrome c-type biogenesis protein CcmH